MDIITELSQITLTSWLKGLSIVIGVILVSTSIGIIIGKTIKRGDYDDR